MGIPHLISSEEIATVCTKPRNDGDVANEVHEFMKRPCVYILSNKYHTTLYIGVTSNIVQRMVQHKGGLLGGFSARYNLTQLLHFEEYDNMDAAIAREKQLKSWSRKRKDALITANNPEWKDLLTEE